MADCIVVFNYLLQYYLSNVSTLEYRMLHMKSVHWVASVCEIRSGCTWRSHMTKSKKWRGHFSRLIQMFIYLQPICHLSDHAIMYKYNLGQKLH